MNATHWPSGDTRWSRIGCVLFRIGTGAPTILSSFASNATRRSVDLQSRLPYATFVPAREKLMSPPQSDGVVIASGSRRTRPEASSIGSRQRFIEPPRLLANQSHFPSADHAGLQSSGASLVTSFPSLFASEPSAATVKMSRCPELPRSPQNAMRLPCGDQLGCIASAASETIRFRPVSISTAASPAAFAPRSLGKRYVPLATTSSLPSGDHVG